MPNTDLLIAFAVATATFALYPGPALLYTAAQTVARGRRAGLMAVLGLHLGGYAHVAAATFGLSALLASVPVMFLVLKICGAAYLVWLGIEMLRAKPVAEHGLPALPRGTGRALFESVLVELTNPKVALFFLAFLPQFLDPAATLPVWAQLLILGTIVNLSFSAVDLVAVMAAATIAARVRAGSRLQRAGRRLAGGVMIGLGLKLATDR